MILLEVSTWGYGLLIAGLAVLATVFLYRTFLSDQIWYTKVFFITIRSLVIGVLVLVLLKPAVTETDATSLQGVVALMDRSFSMDLPAGDGSRYRAARQSGNRLVDRLKEQASVRKLSFGDTVSTGWPSKPDDARTDLVGALQTVLAQTERNHPVVLLSDGAGEQTDRLTEVARQYARAGRSISTFVPGEVAHGERRIVDVRYSNTVRRSDTATIRVTVSGPGSFPVRLRHDGLLAEKVATPGTGTETVELSHVSHEIGPKQFSVSIPAGADEIAREDNDLTFSQRIIRPEVRTVLVAWSYPTWDVRSIVDSLEDVSDLKVVESDGSLEPASWSSARSEPYYDVVIMTGLPASKVNPAMREHVRSLVEGGSGFLMLGGEYSFGAGGWDGTAIGSVLPVEPGEGEVYTGNSGSFEISRLGRPHSVLEPFGERLPAVPTINRWGGAKPGSRVLANDMSLSQSIMVEGRYGSGRTMAIAGEGFWKWTYNRPNGREQLSSFWNRLVGHLSPESGEGFSVTFDRLRSRLGKRVTASINAKGSRGSIDWTMKGAGVDRSGTIPAGSGSVEVAPPDTGTLVLTASMNNQYGRQQQAEAVLNVENRAYEFIDPSVRQQLLADVARITGGEHGRFEEGPDRADDISIPETRVVTNRTTKEVWDQPWLLTLFIGLLGVEWTSRRLSGLR